jgi:hypothetical protein
MLLPILVQASTASGDACAPSPFCQVGLPLASGGVCLGTTTWIAVSPGERTERRTYPDAMIHTIRLLDGRDLTISVSAPAPKPQQVLPTLLVRDGERIRQSTIEDGVRSYYAGGWTFTGTVFDGSQADARVFDRVRFGAAAARLCGAKS